MRLVLFCILQIVFGTHPAARIHTQVQGLTSSIVEASGFIRDASAKQRMMRSELAKKSYEKSASQREEVQGNVVMNREKCLDFDSNNGVTAKLQTCHNGGNQKWQLNKGHLKVMTEINQCVSVTSQSFVFLTECNTSDSSQKWYASMGAAGEGHYLRKTGNESQCLGTQQKKLTLIASSCVSGKGANRSHQKWYFAESMASLLSNKQVDGKCLDLDDGNVPRLASCSNRKQQRWYRYKWRLRTIEDVKLCLHANRNSGEVSMKSCALTDEGLRWDFGGRRLKALSRCLQRGADNSLVQLASTCEPDNTQQEWYFTQASALPLGTEKDNTCLGYHHKDGRVTMEECSLINGQAWYFDKERLKTKQDISKCLYYDKLAKLVIMISCSGDSNELWTLKNKKLKVEKQTKCLEYKSKAEVKMQTCSSVNRQRWFFLDSTAA